MRLIIVTAVLALAACGNTATTEPATTAAEVAEENALPPGEVCPDGRHAVGETSTFTCTNNVTFTVAYEQDTGCALVNAGGQTYRLGSAISGSGARYSNGTTQFWEHQGDGLLEGAAGGPYADCKAPEPD